MTDSKRCFVIMGFGTKTDLATGRKLNLDKSYQALIKPVIENKGMICVRADEIPHSGVIDLPMYQQLLSADIVVADLSTANSNALYELGIRHALRPRTTIVISEDQLYYPFDLNHILINKYTHLGDSIDYFEVLRFQKHLAETLDGVLNDTKPDSPVYTFLDDLIPPALKKKARAVAKQVGVALATAQAETDDNKNDDPNKTTLSLIVSQGEEALRNKQFQVAKGLFNSALLISSASSENIINSNNAYLMQRLALATYKSEQPDRLTALNDANALLAKLDIAHSNDSATVVLAGAVAKRLYETGVGDSSLDDAILYYLRGYYLLHNRYNGINLAYLLNCRVDSSLDKNDDERIADLVWANRIRKEVLTMCEKDWKQILQRESNSDLQSKTSVDKDFSSSQQLQENEQKFWILVNRAEANFGLGNMDEYHQARAQAEALENAEKLILGFSKQVEALGKLLAKHGKLINLRVTTADLQPL